MYFRHCPSLKQCLRNDPIDRKEENKCPTSSSSSGLENQNNKKARLADKITKDVMDVFDYGEESVSVGFEEIKSKDWKEKVYKPDIQNKWDKLYKKPGYEM